MSMISLTIAPLLRNNTTYYEFGYGLIPIGLMFLVAIFAHNYAGGIMDDPDVGGDAPREEAVELTETQKQHEHLDGLHSSGAHDADYLAEQKELVSNTE